jgi:hypothetical protein
MSCEKQNNGRVNLISPDTNVLFAMKDKIYAGGENTDFRQAMTGNWYDTQLSTAFFSGQNIQAIQNGLRAGVYNRSNGQYIIGEQNPDELKIIMRSTFLQYSRNDPHNIPGQIAALNKLVLDYAIGQVYGEAEGYMKYVHDASTMYDPIARPVMSTVNDKQLVLKKWF